MFKYLPIFVKGDMIILLILSMSEIRFGKKFGLAYTEYKQNQVKLISRKSFFSWAASDVPLFLAYLFVGITARAGFSAIA